MQVSFGALGDFFGKIKNGILGAILSIGDVLRIKPIRVYDNWAKKTAEQIFENCRKEIDEHLPTRLQCIYAVTDDQIDIWIDKLNAITGGYQILEIKPLENSMVCVDESIFDDSKENLSYYSLTESANDYWKSVDLNTENMYLPVYLISSDVEVVDIIKEHGLGKFIDN